MRLPSLVTTLFLVSAGPLAGQTMVKSLDEADVEAIRSVWHEWCAAALAGDLDRSLTVYSDHAVEIFTSLQSNISKANIGTRTRPWFENGTFTSCENEVLMVEGVGSTAFSVANSTQTWVRTRDEAVIEYAFTLWAMMKRGDDGEWRLLVVHWEDAS